jgi:hypothetical protein
MEEKLKINRFTCDRCGAVEDFQVSEKDYSEFKSYHIGWAEIHAQAVTSEATKHAVIEGKYTTHLCCVCLKDFKDFMQKLKSLPIEGSGHNLPDSMEKKNDCYP